MKVLEIGKAIKYKYKDFDKENNYLYEIVNIYDEVNFHSKLIFSLLLNEKNLFSFLSVIGIEAKAPLNVYKEKNKIDILIKNSEIAIIIENKINAIDQDKQLERYYNTIISKGYKQDNIYIIYLTLTGNEPSKSSLGNLTLDYVQIRSYKKDIIEWLNECLKNSVLKPMEREFIKMYIEIIEKITYGDYNTMEQKEIINEISKNIDNFKSALLISSAMNEVKKSIQRRFWSILKNKLSSKGYRIVNDEAKESSIDNYYNGTKNRFYYGIEIELNSGFYFRIEIDRNILFGIKKKNNDRNVQQLLSKKGYKSNDHWSGYKYSEFVNINFELLDSKKVEQLLDDKHGKIFVDNFIREFIDDLEKINNYT
jgi:hypothetical protein